MKSYYKNQSQLGFTLIELMISMVLGLLIILAALALFYGSSKNLRVQEAASDVQDASTFGLNYVKNEIAMANLGTHTGITQDSAWTGVVFTGSIKTDKDIPGSNPVAKHHIGNLRGVTPDITNSEPDFSAVVSLDKVNDTSVDIDLNSNVSKVGTLTDRVYSDQLTIQYQAPFALKDCEGRDRQKGDIVVERFFTRQDNTTKDAEAYNIVLVCDAGWYTLDPPNPDDDVIPSRVAGGTFLIQDFNDNGTVLVNRVDYLRIKLGVLLEDGLKYMTIEDYMKTTKDPVTNEEIYVEDGPVMAVQLGVIIRGVEPVGAQTPVTFDVLGDSVEITEQGVNYVRRVYESTIYLRNGVPL